MKQDRSSGNTAMHRRIKIFSFLLFDVCATLVSAAFVWFWAWFYYEDFRPPDLSGIPHTVPQLQREISYISFWCIGLAAVAAGINFVIVRHMGRALNFQANTAQKFAIWSSLVHWLFLFLPTLVFAYNFWVLHTTFKL